MEKIDVIMLASLIGGCSVVLLLTMAGIAKELESKIEALRKEINDNK